VNEIKSVCWRLWACSEAPASRCASASSPLYRLAENIGFATIVVTELKLREVEREILRADMMVRANDSALEQRPETFNAVGMNLTANVFVLGMLHGFVFITQSVQVVIATVLIGSDKTHLIADNLADKAVERSRVRSFDYLTDYIAFTADRADNRSFPAQTGNVLFLTPMAILVFAVKTRLVYFDDAHKLLEVRIVHRGAEPMRHVPSRAHRSGLIEIHAPKLERRNPFFGRQYSPENFEPNVERAFSVLEDRSSREREPIGIAFSTVLIRALPFPRLIDVVDELAFVAARTNGAIRPTPHHQVFPTSVLVGKVRHELSEIHHA
jgi:hypothetical protein